MTAPTITALVNLPNRSDPANFSTYADALWPQINTMVGEMNDLGSFLETPEGLSEVWGVQLPVAAAYVNGAAATLIASAGIGSITRNSTGHYSFTFSETQPGTATMFSGMININASPTLSVSAITTTGFDLKTYASGTLTDVYFSFQAWRVA